MLKLSALKQVKIESKIRNILRELEPKKEKLSGKEDDSGSKESPKDIFIEENKIGEDSILKIKQKANEKMKSSIDFAVNTSQKIDRNIREGIQRTKESSVFQGVQAKAFRLKSIDQKDKNKYKRKLVWGLVKIRNSIFELFEKFVGRIRIGTQYGKSSIELLSELAKLKELGIITEKEFDDKKKEILGRI